MMKASKDAGIPPGRDPDVALLNRAGQPAHIFQSGDPLMCASRFAPMPWMTACLVSLFNSEARAYGTNTEMTDKRSR
jgi:hypothetical protein